MPNWPRATQPETRAIILSGPVCSRHYELLSKSKCERFAWGGRTDTARYEKLDRNFTFTFDLVGAYVWLA